MLCFNLIEFKLQNHVQLYIRMVQYILNNFCNDVISSLQLSYILKYYEQVHPKSKYDYVSWVVCYCFLKQLFWINGLDRIGIRLSFEEMIIFVYSRYVCTYTGSSWLTRLWSGRFCFLTVCTKLQHSPTYISNLFSNDIRYQTKWDQMTFWPPCKSKPFWHFGNLFFIILDQN